jgi:hypothetical protein
MTQFLLLSVRRWRTHELAAKNDQLREAAPTKTPGASKRALGPRLGVRNAIPISRCQHDSDAMGSNTGRSPANGMLRYTNKPGAVALSRVFVTRLFVSADARAFGSTAGLSKRPRFTQAPTLGAWTGSRSQTKTGHSRNSASLYDARRRFSR